MKTERWVFTERELKEIADGKNPVLRGDDEFIASYVWDEEEDISVITYRNGEASNRYADGTVGVSEEDIELTGDIEEFSCIGSEEIADQWRDVIVSDLGFFVKFA